MLIAEQQFILIYPGQQRGSSARRLSGREERWSVSDGTEMNRKVKAGEEEEEGEMETGR